jgi:tRNA G18 (ribose-2'-O)-methylase SpoU
MEAFPFRAVAPSLAYEGIGRIPVCVVLDCIRSLYNVGSFFRTGDAAGISTLYLTGYTGHPPHPRLSKTALGAQDKLPWEHHPDPSGLLQQLRHHGFELAAIETSSRAIDLYDWQPRFPVCLVFGNEVEGIPAPIAALCDVDVRIPMLGAKQSLNVAVAGGVVLFELLRKYRMLHESFRRLAAPGVVTAARSDA